MHTHRLLIPLTLLLLAAFSPPAAAQPEVRFHRQYVDGRFGQVHVLSSRPIDAETRHTPVACFAPNPASGNYLRMFMGSLGQDRIMLAPDLPGLGASDPPPEMTDIAAYAGAMADALEALGYGERGSGAVDVCGYHTGAFVAIELAADRPDLVRRLVLMGIPFYTGEARHREYEKNVRAHPYPARLEDLQGSWDFAVTNRERGVTLERGFANFIDVLRAVPRRHWAYHAVFTYPAEDRAPLVMQPVLILNTHGGLKQETRDIAPLFPHALLVEVPELHHGIFDVGADLLAARAREFLDQEIPPDPLTARR